MGCKWEEQYITNIEIMKISNLLHEMYIMKTLDIFNSEKFPKLHTYKKFKQDCRPENHLLHLENRGHQIALTKFRISSHNLRIETGRYENNSKLEPYEGLCIFCDRLDIENEFHFLLEYHLYNNKNSPDRGMQDGN